MAVAEDLEVRLAVDTDFVVGINAHQGHLAQHGQHVVGLAVGVLGHIVANAVHILLDELTLCSDLNILELDVVKHVQQRIIDPIVVIGSRGNRDCVRFSHDSSFPCSIVVPCRYSEAHQDNHSETQIASHNQSFRYLFFFNI